MNAVLIGSVSSSEAALRGMLRGGLPVAGVLGLHERHATTVGDYRNLRPLAESAGVPYLAFDKVGEPQVRVFLESVRPDWLFVVGLSQLIPAELRTLARAGAVGFHPTLLPEGRGRAPVAWTILLDRPAAANLFFLTDEPDAGDLIAQRPVPVLPDDYACDLIERTNVVLEELLVETAPLFRSGQVPRTPQDHSRATYYARRRPADGLIDWCQPAEHVYRLIRAAGRPYPGAFTLHRGVRLTIWRGKPVPAAGRGGAPGTVISTDEGRPLVQTASGLILVTDMEYTGPSAGPPAIGDVLGGPSGQTGPR